jgi:Mlc titration factor MtfA (ptsG expression regulator)
LEFHPYIQGTIEAAIIHAELEKFYPYYNTLNTNDKKKFIQRTATFIASKKFVPRQDIFLSQHIVILISACAVQITFGLNEYAIEHFEYILIYPDIYNSPMTGKQHKGETNLSGFICFSWKHVQSGIDNTNDNYNLGLHEWMHALRFNGFKGATTDYFFENYINKWISVAMSEYTRLKNGRTSIFRKYGAENINEFLSVCTEHFFESPDEFEKELPELFKHTCILLNQKPGKISTTVNVRNKFLSPDSSEFTAHETPEMEIEASILKTIKGYSIRFLFYGFLLPFFLMANNIVSDSIAAIATIGMIISMNNRYFSLCFYKNHLYFQKGFFDSFSEQTSLSYNQIIKIEKEENQYDSDSFYSLNITFYDSFEFKTKRVALDMDTHTLLKVVALMKKKNILNNIN